MGVIRAEGGYGAVWLATQTALGRSAAVKVLKPDVVGDPEQIQRFLAEARVTAALSHPSIVVVLDCDAEAGIPWIAYEHIPGKTVRQLLATGPLPIRRALTAARQVTEALTHAHNHRVLHRDIKPENVLCAHEDRFKLADFGIAKWLSSESIRTRTGLILGTPTAMAPELIDGAPPSEQTDLYALGALLYELATGQELFPGASLTQVLDHQLHTPPPRITDTVPSVPVAVDTLVQSLLAKDPQARPGKAADVAATLEVLMEAADASQDQIAPPSRTHSFARPVSPPGTQMGAGLPATREVPRLRRAALAPSVGPSPTQPPGRRPGPAALVLGVTVVTIALCVAYRHAGNGPTSGVPIALHPPDPSVPSSMILSTPSPSQVRPPTDEQIARWAKAVTDANSAWEGTLSRLSQHYDLVGAEGISQLGFAGSDETPRILLDASRHAVEGYDRIEASLADAASMAPVIEPAPLRALARARGGRFLDWAASQRLRQIYTTGKNTLVETAQQHIGAEGVEPFRRYLDALALVIDRSARSPAVAGTILLEPLCDLSTVVKLFDVLEKNDPGMDRYRVAARAFFAGVNSLSAEVSVTLGKLAGEIIRFHLFAVDRDQRRTAVDEVRQSLLILDASVPGWAHSSPCFEAVVSDQQRAVAAPATKSVAH